MKIQDIKAHRVAVNAIASPAPLNGVLIFVRLVGLAALLSLATTVSFADNVEVLVVGGGGGGCSGGGGGGGGQYQSSFAVTLGTPYTVVIGAGGTGAQDNLSTAGAANGANSSFDSITANGGGGGGNTGNSGYGTGSSGGSGGGGGANAGGTTSGGTGSQGYSGGGNGGFLGAPYPGGGGGGGGAAGGNATSSSVAGDGGAGYASSIAGSSQTYAGGGGGATYSPGTAGNGGSGGGGNGVSGGNGQSGGANTGGGGGGASSGSTGGSGGSGIVIIRYAGAPRGTGGTITSSGGYTVHTFTSSGSFTLSNTPLVTFNLDVLVVGGGGGGCSGGGGGGGVKYLSSFAVVMGAPYSVVIGAGGAGAQDNLSTAGAANGSNSSFSSITANGGGGGGNTGNSGYGAGTSGGSGGGGGAYAGGTTSGGTGSQGSNGGGNGGFLGAPYPGGGGGGGGAAGGNATSSSVAGDGGAGYASSIAGSSQTYAGGGGGATWASGTPGSGGSGGGGNGVDGGNGQNGAVNTGGGGGGANNTYTGGAGGSGIVIIRYAGAPCATGGTIASTGGYTTHTFTSNGTFQLLNPTQTLPFFTGFESADGYATGSVNNQDGWMVMTGAASVTTADFTEGSRSLTLEAGATSAMATLGFAAPATPDITFLDFEIKPVAASAAAGSSLVQTEAAKVGFQIVSSGVGEIYVYDGVGANQWVATGRRFNLNGSNQATNWLRLTLRLDYTAKTWDLFVDGVMADFDLAFANNSETYLRQLLLTGSASASTSIDAILVGNTNPLFTDADKDGMDDAWEIAHGLNPTVNDRNGDLDGDGYTNIEEYFLGTDPNNADVTKPSVPAGLASNSVTETTLGLSWSASTDTGAGTPGVAGYIVYRNGARLNTALITATSYTDTGLSAATSYAYTVRAVDLAGNISDVPATFNGATGDTHAPTVPAGLATSSLAPTSFTLNWTASTDNVGVTAYEVFKDGVSQGTTASLNMSFTGLIQGTTYAMTVRARDAAGNWSAQSTALNVTTATGGIAIQYTYDASGRVVQAKYIGSSTQNYTHSSTSNLTQVSTTTP